MTYQVLARKWRPRSFARLVGQEHVVRALVNALDSGRLHHAYLFTGTRGVGKTTIARIIAKALNCEQGVSSKPCGECSACREVDEGRFVDLIEVDAASRTKVEDTRDLLDYTQYAPTRGRFKVYLIDEVHMLSKHSFNALLKTLEEPPPHVKFLLATTDPQKLPVTVLSRCLQFNLKRLPEDLIAGHLADILAQEGIAAEAPAVAGIARAADGSIRDALSLLDQAIAYGGGALKAAEVRAMLGTIDHAHIHELLAALADGDGARLLACVQQAAGFTVDFSGLLDELLAALQRIAVAQLVPDAVDASRGDAERIAALASSMGREDVQLWYQVALLGRRDLPLAPDPRSGIEMILLRMLAFRPADAASPADADAGGSAAAAKAPARHAAARTTPPAAPARPVVEAGEDWEELISRMNLQGMVRELAVNCVLVERGADLIRLQLDKAHAHLHSKIIEDRLRQALRKHVADGLRLEIRVGDGGDADTPAGRRKKQEQDRLDAALAALEEDAEVRVLKDTFNARIVPGSVQPVE
jgi:DNA polymerase III subunit gamma/tau